MPNNEFEEHETKAGAGRKAGVEQPESGSRHRLIEATDPADEAIGKKESQIIKADHRRVDRLRRVPCEESETYWQEMGEGDAIDDVKSDRPEESDLVTRGLRRRREEETHDTRHRKGHRLAGAIV